MTTPPPDREATLKHLRELRPELKAHAEVASARDLEWDIMSLVYEGLAFGNNAARQATEKVIRENGLGPRGAWILNMISNGIEYPLELASFFRVTRSLITHELARLTEAGLITSKPGATDRRRTALALTRKGLQATQQVRDEMLRIARSNLAGYSGDDVLLFIRMLQDMRGSDDDFC